MQRAKEKASYVMAWLNKGTIIFDTINGIVHRNWGNTSKALFGQNILTGSFIFERCHLLEFLDSLAVIIQNFCMEPQKTK